MSAMEQSLLQILGVSCRVKVVDIGANPIDGHPPYQPLIDAGIADIVGFEPNLDALALLNEQKGSHETYLPHAVGDGKPHSIQICQAQGMTSLLEPDPVVLGLMHGFPEWGRVVSRQPLDTVRLDDVPEVSDLDYLKIDIQGGELMVFENAVDRLAEASIVHTEVEFLPLYKNQPLFADVDLFMRRQGFYLHKFDPIRSRALAPIVVRGDIYNDFNQVFWGDAIYLRSILDLPAYRTEKLLSLAVILHDCYRSIDVAHHLLAEYDRRQKTRHAETYLAAITGGKTMEAA